MFSLQLKNVAATAARSAVMEDTDNVPEHVKSYVVDCINIFIEKDGADTPLFVNVHGHYGDGYEGLCNVAVEVRKPIVS